MPPFLDQCVLANEAVPNPGGTVDLFGASWDTIPAAAVPVQQQSFVLLLSMLLEPDEARREHVIDVAVVTEHGERLSGLTINVGPVAEAALAALDPGQSARIETVVGARGISYPAYGYYEVVINWDDQELRRPMRFRVVPPPADESPEASD